MDEKPPPKAAGLILCAVGAIFMIASAFSHAWLLPRFGASAGVSPLSMKLDGQTHSLFSIVSEAQARAAEFDDPDAPSSAWPVAGLVAFIFVLVGGVGALATAGLVWRGLRPETPIAASTLALLGSLIALIAGCVFVMSKPTRMADFRIGWGFWAFGLGSMAALLGAQFLAKHLQPIDPDPV